MTIFKELIGKKINGIFIGNDKWALVFRDTEGKFYRYDTQNDCCNTVYINHLNGVTILGGNNEFDLLRGVTVTGAEDKGWGENREDVEGCEVVQDGFWTIKTDRGYIDIEVRNEHNGYYGGSLVEIDRGIADIENLEQVFEDF